MIPLKIQNSNKKFHIIQVQYNSIIGIHLSLFPKIISIQKIYIYIVKHYVE